MSVEFYRESPGKFDSGTLSRETLGRWTGRKLGQPNTFLTFNTNIENNLRSERGKAGHQATTTTTTTNDNNNNDNDNNNNNTEHYSTNTNTNTNKDDHTTTSNNDSNNNINNDNNPSDLQPPFGARRSRTPNKINYNEQLATDNTYTPLRGEDPSVTHGRHMSFFLQSQATEGAPWRDGLMSLFEQRKHNRQQQIGNTPHLPTNVVPTKIA